MSCEGGQALPTGSVCVAACPSVHFPPPSGRPVLLGGEELSGSGDRRLPGGRGAMRTRRAGPLTSEF